MPSATVLVRPGVDQSAPRSFTAITERVAGDRAPSSSVTVTVTVYVPLSAYTWLPATVPLAPAVEPGGPNGVSADHAGSVAVPSPQSIVAVCVSRVPRSLNVAGARLTSCLPRPPGPPRRSPSAPRW